MRVNLRILWAIMVAAGGMVRGESNAELFADQGRSQEKQFHGYALRPVRTEYVPVTMHDSFARVRGPGRADPFLYDEKDAVVKKPRSGTLSIETMSYQPGQEAPLPRKPKDGAHSLGEALKTGVEPAYDRLRFGGRSDDSKFERVMPADVDDAWNADPRVGFDPDDLNPFEDEYRELIRLNSEKDAAFAVRKDRAVSFFEPGALDEGSERFRAERIRGQDRGLRGSSDAQVREGGLGLAMPSSLPGPTAQSGRGGMRELTDERGWLSGASRGAESSASRLSSGGLGALSQPGTARSLIRPAGAGAGTGGIDRDRAIAPPRSTMRPSALRGRD